MFLPDYGEPRKSEFRMEVHFYSTIVCYATIPLAYALAIILHVRLIYYILKYNRPLTLFHGVVMMQSLQDLAAMGGFVFSLFEELQAEVVVATALITTAAFLTIQLCLFTATIVPMAKKIHVAIIGFFTLSIIVGEPLNYFTELEIFNIRLVVWTRGIGSTYCIGFATYCFWRLRRAKVPLASSIKVAKARTKMKKTFLTKYFLVIVNPLTHVLRIPALLLEAFHVGQNIMEAYTDYTFIIAEILLLVMYAIPFINAIISMWCVSGFLRNRKSMFTSTVHLK